jgi:hypothetical protein
MERRIQFIFRWYVIANGENKPKKKIQHKNPSPCNSTSIDKYILLIIESVFNVVYTSLIGLLRLLHTCFSRY